MVQNSIKRPSERPSKIRVINVRKKMSRNIESPGAPRVFIVEKHVPDGRRLFNT